MTYQNYEFTAFAESDLVDGNLNCGDHFTMPGAATVCISVTDNDSFLSGDNCHNENANDHYGQHASIEGADGGELGNGGQIYAEVYHWVYGSDGTWYVMIEIEQEGDGADYFTFYTGHGYTVPEEGTELTVHSKCNVTSNWIDFKCLDAGEKPEPADPWEFNTDTCTYTVEAESWDLHNFKVVDGAQASGGELVKIAAHDGKISTAFGGESGVYNMTINAQDETDGVSKLMVYVNGEFQQTIRLDQQSDGGGSNNGGFTGFTLQGLEIAEGDTVEIRAWKDNCEFVRIDNIEFEQVKFEECDMPGAVKLDFEGFAAGDILADLDGLTISAMGGSGDAMVFDSQNPTGGDGDLETQVAQLGNVLIVSEDGDSSDPDDVVGGKLIFDFDNPSAVFDLKVVDTEEGGTITLTLADGSTQEFDIPNLVNGGVGQVVMNVENVVSMEVALNGSGAIDDLCYVPGEEQVPLGALSGTYFCDENRNAIDDGASVGDLDVAGKNVDLFTADGVFVSSTTTNEFGDYRFDDLVAGDYYVEFESSQGEGKRFVAQNVGNDDANDSDVDATGRSDVVSVFADEETTDLDAGVEKINNGPVAVEDAGMGCADELITVNVLDNDTDADAGDVLTVTAINGQAITEGGSVEIDGVTISLIGGELVFDGETAFAALDIGQEETVGYTYTVSDGTDTSDADVFVTFKGDANSAESLDAALQADGGTQVTFQLDVVDVAGFVDAYTLNLLSSTNEAIALDVYNAAYCIDALQPIDQGVLTTADVYVATEANAALVSGNINADKIDSVNWLLNNDYTLIDNGDGTGDTYTDLEVQEAIWVLLNDDNFVINEFTNPEFTDNENGVRDGAELATLENIQEIAMAAMNLGDGFEAGDGDIIGLILDPTAPTAQEQPFIIGVNFDDIDCIC